MNKAALLRLVNPVLFFSFVVQAVTGVILFFDWKVPGGELVANVHSCNGLFMVLLAATHIFLNWGWITNNFLKRA